jgi:hypothetical protein
MNPVGPSSPTTYWIRRVLAVVLAVAVLVGVVLYLASRTSRSSAGSDPAAAANTSAAPTMTGVLANSTGPSRSTVPPPSPSPSAAAGESPVPASGSPAPADSQPATDSAAPVAPAAPTDAAPTDPAPVTDTAAAPPPEPAAPPPPAPSYDADGKLLCADASITLGAQLPAEVTSGANVIVGMTVTNSGAEACRRDVSGTLQVFTVFGADSTRMWSTADCFPGQGTDVRDLAPGQSLKYTVKWSGTTSAPGCTGDRTHLAAGSYTLIAQLGTLSSPPAAFTVT